MLSLLVQYAASVWHIWTHTKGSNVITVYVYKWDMLMEMKERSLWSIHWQTGAVATQSRIWGVSFIHHSLSSYDKGQALTKAEVRSGSVTSSWPVSPSQPLVWSLLTVHQPGQHLSAERRGRLTPNTERQLIQEELDWHHIKDRHKESDVTGVGVFI